MLQPGNSLEVSITTRYLECDGCLKVAVVGKDKWGRLVYRLPIKAEGIP